MKENTYLLIADDNVSLCRTMALVLRKRGYLVQTSHNASDTIEEVKKRPVDVVFLDIKMSPLDGMGTFRKIRKIRPEARIIMMTAYGPEDLVKEALEEGAYAVLYKPFEMDRVLSLIEETTGPKRGLHILVVDPDEEVRTFLEGLLEVRGHRVTCAAEGADAIHKARQMKCHLLLIEKALPDADGLKICASLQEINPAATAVMMTHSPHGTEKPLKEALKKTAFAWLEKPLETEIVLKLLERVLSERRKPPDPPLDGPKPLPA